jgi:hypothetical protein
MRSTSISGREVVHHLCSIAACWYFRYHSKSEHIVLYCSHLDDQRGHCIPRARIPPCMPPQRFLKVSLETGGCCNIWRTWFSVMARCIHSWFRPLIFRETTEAAQKVAQQTSRPARAVGSISDMLVCPQTSGRLNWAPADRYRRDVRNRWGGGKSAPRPADDEAGMLPVKACCPSGVPVFTADIECNF